MGWFVNRIAGSEAAAFGHQPTTAKAAPSHRAMGAVPSPPV
ncbi:MAG: hypothetical protein RLZ97_911 [Verrucomicrobiota bacterium]